MRLCAGYLRRACAPALRRHCQRPSSALRLARAAQQSAAHATASAMQQQGGRQGQQPPAAAVAAAEQGPAGAGTGGTVLDREQFRQQLEVQALRIPTKQCNQYMKLLSKHLLNKPRMKNIQDVSGDPQHKLLLLSEQVTAQELPGLEVSRDGRSVTVGEVAAADGLEVCQAQVEVDYSYYSASAVLQRILPPGSEVPSAFETVGHIAHLNLREELLPWKHVIGQVILDKNPRLRTVVNKVGTIENEWRVFQMEVLAARPAQEQQAQQGQQGQGERGGGAASNAVSGWGSGMETEVRQHGARFRLDFSKVYWNSRLEAEHHRLVGGFQPGEVVLDVMAGIGPFAVPAAQKGCTVWANDLNPDSFRWLRTNIQLNRVAARVVPFNLDGREAIRLAARGALPVAAAAAEAAAAAAEAVGGSQQGKPKAREGKGPAADQAAEQQQLLQQDGTAAAAAAAAPEASAAAGAAAAAGKEGKPKQAKQQQQKAQALPPPPEHPAAGGIFQHAVMNLPASAVEFLDAFNGAFDPEMWAGRELPLVHVYTFCKGDEDEAGMQARVEAALGGPLDAPPAFHLVRDVAPNKKMYCISFRVPPGLAFAGAGEGQAAEGAGGKRQKVA